MSKPKLKLGIQCQERVEEVYRYNLQLRPIVVKSINVLDPGHYARLAADNPGVDLVYRQVPNGPWHDDPEGDGRRWAEHLYRLVGHIPQITLVEGHNEWIHGPDHQTPDDFDRADRFMFAFIRWVHELWDERVHAVVLNASCGHFNEDLADFFPRTLTRLNSCGKCLLALHEYDHPNKDMLGDGRHDLCGKFLRNLAGLRAAGYDRVRVAITEFGVDSGVGGSGHVGFKYWGTMAWARYLNDRNLGWYLPLVQECEGVAWATIFGCGMHGDWETFDIAGTHVIDGIEAIYSNWVPPEEPPEPPPNGGNMIRVFDLDGIELSEEAGLDRIAFHGVTVHQPVGLRQGEWYWDVVRMRESMGPACFIYTGLLEDGAPAVGQQAAWAWADDMGDADDIEGANYPTDWQEEADLGFLNENGNMGPAYGQHGWFHAPYEPGPGRAWIRDPLRWSVRLTGMGMLNMTNHHTMFATWRLRQWEGGEPPTPPEPPGELMVVLQGIKTDTGRAVVLLQDIKKALDGQPPPPPVLEPYKAEYFANREMQGPPVVTLEHDRIDFDWGGGSPTPGLPTDNFSVRFTATRHFEAGTWNFHVRVDDGVRLYVDGHLLIEQWFDQAPHIYDAQISLAQGDHTILVEYYERGGGAVCEMSYAKA